jgi:hypothetical protein
VNRRAFVRVHLHGAVRLGSIIAYELEPLVRLDPLGRIPQGDNRNHRTDGQNRPGHDQKDEKRGVHGCTMPQMPTAEHPGAYAINRVNPRSSRPLSEVQPATLYRLSTQ